MAAQVDTIGNVAECLADARAGSREALGDLLENFRQYLHLVAKSDLAKDLQAKGGASDLVQETFLEAQLDFSQFRGNSEEELRAWLLQILRHNLANFRRDYRATGKRQLDRERSLNSSSFAPIFNSLAADHSSPSGHVLHREQLEQLQRALERLPDDYRQAIVLRHRDNCTFEALGQLLGRSADAARMLWWRALERLQKEMEPTT